MEDRKLNEKESLDLIAGMIRNTQNKMRQNVGRPLLILGYISVIVALGIWFANLSTGDYRWNYIWFLVPVVGWALVFRHNRKHHYATTYIDRIINYVWLVFGSGMLIACSVSVFLWDFQGIFVTALMMGMMSVLIGLIVRVKSITWSGIAGMLISPVSLVLDDDYQKLFLAVLFVFLLILPGHILSIKNKKQA